jgi:hypothetical protein
MLFVVGTGRSGTKTLAEMLRGCGLDAHHEPEPLLTEEVLGLLRGDLTEADLARMLRDTRPTVHGGPEYAESSHVLSYVIPSLEAAFGSQARYVWLIRDGREVVSSVMARAGFRNAGSDWLIGSFDPVLFGKESAADDFSRACWYWALTHMEIERALRCVAPERKMSLCLEQLASERHRLASHFGIHSASRVTVPVLNQARRGKASYATWSTDDRLKFERICGPVMDRHYPEWRGPDGRWADVRSSSAVMAGQKAIQRGMRIVVLADVAVLRWARGQVRRRAPARVYRRLRRILGM